MTIACPPRQRPAAVSSRKIRLGIVGCGAITENAHLPAALTSPCVELTALSDTNLSRLRYIERQFGLGAIGTCSYQEIYRKIDAVVLALPNHLHAPVGCDFLSQGIHVLCEKPLAVSTLQCEQLCEVAKTNAAVLAVGYVTRFFPSTALTKHLIDSRFLGRIESFDYEFGTEGGWAPLSGYNLCRSTSGGGVLVVSGSHFVDRMLYLFGNVELIEYSDDSRGGIEANCIAGFRAMLGGDQMRGRVTLSKTHRLSNRLRIFGEKGYLQIAEGHARSVLYVSHDGFCHEICPGPNFTGREENYFRTQLEDFARAINTGVPPAIDGEEGSKSVALMEHCYANRLPLDEPWCDVMLPWLSTALPGKAQDSSEI